MSGFESRIIDRSTKEKSYDRKTTDSEEIPLFYEFLYPKAGQDYALALFQSFQGRSCVTKIRTAFRTEFKDQHHGYTVNVKKLMPGDLHDLAMQNSLVKRLTLIKRNASSDITDRYIESNIEHSDIEFSISSRPRKNLGNLKNLVKSLRMNDGVITHDGITYEEAVADVRIGDRLRRVGLLGPNTEAGVIDITNDVTTAQNGHPEYDSLAAQADNILKSFHQRITPNKDSQ